MPLLKDDDLFLVSDKKNSYKITKKQLKAEVGGSQVLVGETPPDFVTDGLEEGTLWWDNSSDDARLYILFDDTVSGNGLTWVDASPPGGGSAAPPDETVTIKKPEVLTPPPGAGLGGDVTYTPKTSAITNVQTVVGTGGEFNPSYNSNYTYSNGNKTAATEVATQVAILTGEIGTVGTTTGVSEKVQFRIDRFGTSYTGIGFIVEAQDPNNWLGSTSDSIGLLVNAGGYSVWTNGASIGSQSIVVELGDIFELAYDFDTKQVKTWHNGTFQGNSVWAPISSVKIFPGMGSNSGGGETVTVGTQGTTQLTLTDSNTYNNADGADMGVPISETFTAGQTVKGAKASGTYGTETAAFTTTLYTGNTTATEIPTGVDNTGKALLWIKSYDGAYGHTIFDTARGPDNYLESHTTKHAAATTDLMTSFLPNGFTLGTKNNCNRLGTGFAAWNFRGAAGFFDVVTYEGNSTPRSIKHDLGSVPGMLIIKDLDEDVHYIVGHKGIGLGNGILYLNRDKAAKLDGADEYWSSTPATSSDFTIGSNDLVNKAGSKFVAWLFGDTPGKIKCDTYKGDGSTAGQEIDCGFKPGWLLLKSVKLNENWLILDRERSESALYPNTSDDESSSFSSQFEWTDTGFKVKGAGAYFNGGNQDYIYVAVKENVTAGGFAPTGTLTADADDSGPTITLADVTGTWEDGMEVVNDTEVTKEAPGADSIVFTSDKPVATSGSVKTWEAEWQLSIDSGFADKQEATVSLNEVDVEQGPTFTLADDTAYWVRTRYTGEGGDVSEWSEVNNFKTAGVTSGADGNFSTDTWTGNSTPKVINNGVDCTGKVLFWGKSRDKSSNNEFHDSETGFDKYLVSPEIGAYPTGVDVPNGQGITDVSSDGYTFGASGNTTLNDGSGVIWTFAAAAGFFDVVSYNASSTPVVPHSLGSTPGVIITKRTDTTSNWYVYHKDLDTPNSSSLVLNLAAGQATQGGNPDIWNPTSTTFDAPQVLIGSGDQVAYLFAENPEGGIKCGSYPGNGGSQSIDVGFKPGWVMIKSIDSGDGWLIFDSKRGNEKIYANEKLSGREHGDFGGFTSKGFDLVAGGSAVNGGSNNYIYVAIADTTTRFYDEKTASTVTNHTLTKRYGVDPLTTDLKKYGVFPLSEQPTYSVAAYVKEGNEYTPIRTYESELNRANARIEELQTNFEARIAALEGN